MLRAVAKYLPFGYLVLIAGAELITTFYDPFWGLVCHALIMFCLYGHAIVLYPTAKKKLVSTYVPHPCTPYPDTIALRASCQFHVFTLVHYIELTAIYRYCHYNRISAAQST